jgi:hypothetical protein
MAGDNSTRIQNAIAIRADIDSIDIWACEVFPQPYKGPAYACTPKDVRELLEDYEDNPEPLPSLTGKHHVAYRTFWELIERFPQVNARYVQARQRKAWQYSAYAQKGVDDIPPEAYEVDKNGCSKLSVAYVRLMEIRERNRIRMAEIHESGTHIQRTQTENRNINVNVEVAAGDLDGAFDPSSFGLL